MAWEARAVEIAAEKIATMLRAGPGGAIEVDLPWRPDVGLGTAVTVGGKVYRVAMLVNPGARNERLRLGLVATAQPTKPKGRRK